MFLLRRAAVRALSQQSKAISRSYQPISNRATSFSQSSSKSITWRGFHQSRIWRAEEEQKGDIAKEGGESPAESQQPPTQAEPSTEEQRTEVKEESIATPDVADAASQESAAETVAEKAEEVVAETTQNFSQAAEAATAAASAATSQYPPPPSRPSHQNPSTHRNPRPSRILYIGNLFFEVNASQLEAEFAHYGTVINSRIVTDSRGLSKGFGYIEMSEQEAANRAMQELDQKVFQGRRMAVQYHIPRDRTRPGMSRDGKPRVNEPSKTLFIGNMSYQMSDRDLNDLFREIRDVLDVRVAIDRRSGQPRGFAHADFIDIESAQRAKELLEKKVVYGRQLRVDYSGQTAPKASS